MIEVSVVCCICRRPYRQAKIVPITPARPHIFGTCDDCKSLGSWNYDDGGGRTSTVAARRNRRTSVSRCSSPTRPD